MKKTIIKIVTVLSVLPFVLFGLCSCNSDEQTKPTTPVSETILLSGFESEAEYLTMLFTNTIAKVEVNQNKEYITEGEASAALTLYGQYDYTNKFYLDSPFYLLPGNDFLSKIDFSDVSSFSVDVFNAFTRPLQFMLSFDGYTIGYRTLEKGMNHLTFELDRAEACHYVDLEFIKTIGFLVEGRMTDEEPAVLYFDNFKAQTVLGDYNEDSYETIDVIDEFNFENPLETKCFVEYGLSTSNLTKPRFSINSDLNYVLYGKNSMKITFMRNRNDTAIDCLGFRTADGVFGNWAAFSDLSKVKLSYDLYNDTDQLLTVSMHVFQATTSSNVYTKTLSIAPHSWADTDQTAVLLSDIQEKFGVAEFEAFTVVFEITGLKESGSNLYLDNLKLTVIS